MRESVAPGATEELLRRIPDFGKAYEPDGLAAEGFDGFGPTVRTLRGFIQSYHDLVGAIRNVVLPDPDTRPG
jgi:transaldolase